MKDQEIFNAIVDEVCTYYKVNVDELTTNLRFHKLAEARFMIFYFARKNTNMTDQQIATPFNRDRGMTIYGYKVIEDGIRFNGLAAKTYPIAERINMKIGDINNKPVQFCPCCKRPMP